MKAIAAVGYFKVIDRDGECHVGFILGKAKLVPLSAHTIPRLELGATVLAVEMAELVQREVDISTVSTQCSSTQTAELSWDTSVCCAGYHLPDWRVGMQKSNSQQ